MTVFFVEGQKLQKLKQTLLALESGGVEDSSHNL